jgi:hypothetical protein
VKAWMEKLTGGWMNRLINGIIQHRFISCSGYSKSNYMIALDKLKVFGKNLSRSLPKYYAGIYLKRQRIVQRKTSVATISVFSIRLNMNKNTNLM